MKLDPEKLKQKIQNTRPTETGVRQQREHKLLLEQAGAAAAARMANELAHNINNPLQSLTNILYLSAQGENGKETEALGFKASHELEKLSGLVEQLLSLPKPADEFSRE